MGPDLALSMWSQLGRLPGGGCSRDSHRAWSEDVGVGFQGGQVTLEVWRRISQGYAPSGGPREGFLLPCQHLVWSFLALWPHHHPLPPRSRGCLPVGMCPNPLFL